MHSALAGRRLATDTLVTQTGRVLQIAFSLAVIVVLARALGPTQFGVFSTIVAVQTAAFALADLGLGQLAMRAVSQQRIQEVTAVRKAVPLLYVAASGVLLLSSIVSLVLLGAGTVILASSILIGISHVHAAARIGVERGFWLGALKFGRATLIDVTAAGLRGAGVTLVWLAGGSGLMSFAVALAVSGLLNVLLVRYWLSYEVPATVPVPVAQTSSHVLRESAPFALTSLAWNTFTELPKMVLAGTFGAMAVGQFAAGARFLAAAYVPLQSVMLVVAPRLFAIAGAATRQSGIRHPLIRYAALTSTVGAALALVIGIIAPLLPRLLGSEYDPAVPVLRVLCVSLPFHALAFATGDWLGGTGHQRVRLLLTVAMLVVAVPVLLAMSLRWGAVGAAAAYSVLIAIISLATAIASQRFVHQ